MARLPRLHIPGYPEHVTHTALQGLSLFSGPQDYEAFLTHLKTALATTSVQLYGYVLLPQRFRLIVQAPDPLATGKLLQMVGRRYVQHVNQRTNRLGTLFAGRFRATPLEPDAHLLTLLQYVEAEPVRAGLVTQADHYRYSSLRHHIGARADELLTDPGVIWGLGNTPFERQIRYRERFEEGLRSQTVASLDEATERGWLLGTLPAGVTPARRIAPLPKGRRRL